MKSIGDERYANEFLVGQMDCRKGEPAKENASEAYNAGYGAEYASQECMAWHCERQEGRTYGNTETSR